VKPITRSEKSIAVHFVAGIGFPVLRLEKSGLLKIQETSFWRVVNDLLDRIENMTMALAEGLSARLVNIARRLGRPFVRGFIEIRVH
jgi:hypothetical protein